MRYVLDTNVIVSALLFHDSVPGRAFFQCLDRGTILISREQVKELTDVLGRKKFDKYVTSAERERFLATLIRDSELVEISELVQECRDPKDDQILALAVSGHASFVITGDKDLLVLDPFRGIRILSPAEVLSNPPDVP